MFSFKPTFIFVHALFSFRSCRDSGKHDDNEHVLAEIPNTSDETCEKKTSDESEEPGETSPLTTPEDDLLESNPNTV